MAGQADYCGHVVESDDPLLERGAWWCCRDPWEGTGRCIWHADQDDKPLEKLSDSLVAFEEGLDDDLLPDHGERLDDAVLPGIDLDELADRVALDAYTLLRADLTGSTLSGDGLAGCCLRGADLTDAELRGADLRGTDLYGANLSATDLRETDLRETDLRTAELTDAELRHADLEGADLRFADLERAGLVRTNLYRAALAGAELSDATLVSADLRDANVRRAAFHGATMRRVDCGRCDDDEDDGTEHDGDSDDDTERTSLREADLRETDCYEARFGNADFRDADLADANLRKACLSDADLADANLADASIEGADIEDAHLERAVLTRTNCFDADLTGATFYGAIFSDTKINGGTTFDVPDLSGFTSRTAANSDHDRYDELIWMYRIVERLSRENALSEQARAAYIDRKDLRRRQYLDDLRPGFFDGLAVGEWMQGGGVTKRVEAFAKWLRTFEKFCGALVAGSVMRYGERPGRVIGVSLLVLVGGAVLYSGPFLESLRSFLVPVEWLYASLASFAGPVVNPFLEGLYVSLVSFVAPVGGDPETISAVEWLRAGEALLGVLLTALLVFVFGRRSTG